MFSVLPPYDVVGTEWAYQTGPLDGSTVSQHACHIDETFTWPDGQPGSDIRCISEASTIVGFWSYALYPDRIQRRSDGIGTYDPPADLYRVPLYVGDVWEVRWMTESAEEVTESYTVLAQEQVEVVFGSFDAAKLEVRTTSSSGTSVVVEWWVDGIGVVLAESDTTRSELLSFTQ